MSKIYLSPSNQYANIGKGEYGTEKDRMWELAVLVKNILAKNFEIKLADFNSSLETRAIESNNFGSDIYVAFHTNAGGGRGCEIYAYSTQSKGYTLAQKIYNYIANATPSNDRGIKFNTLYETKVPIAPAILIEFFFHDSIDDVNWYLSNKESIAIAVSKGIYEYFGIAYEESKPIEQPKPILEIKDIENKKVKLKIDANLWDLSYTNYDNTKSIKKYKAGDIIEVSAVAKHSLGANYYVTEYSFLKGINNGFNINDCEDYIESVTEDPKTILPVIEGYYLDKDNALWYLLADGSWSWKYLPGRVDRSDNESIYKYEPFTPAPESIINEWLDSITLIEKKPTLFQMIIKLIQEIIKFLMKGSEK